MEDSSQRLTKGAWTAEEDSLLRQCIGLNRCRKSCRLRWLNYLSPSIKRGKFSFDEVDLLLRLHKLLGNRWSLIAGRLLGRTANDVKNYWNTNLGKKQETCFKSKMRNREISCSNTTPVQNLNVVRPRPRPLNNNNGCSRLNSLLEVGLGEASTKDGGITCNKDEEKCEFVNNVIDGESMWWESLLEDSEEADAHGPSATTIDKAEKFLINSMLTFDVDQL